MPFNKLKAANMKVYFLNKALHFCGNLEVVAIVVKRAISNSELNAITNFSFIYLCCVWKSDSTILKSSYNVSNLIFILHRHF